jgi:hypothetical protein
MLESGGARGSDGMDGSDGSVAAAAMGTGLSKAFGNGTAVSEDSVIAFRRYHESLTNALLRQTMTKPLLSLRTVLYRTRGLN